MTRQLKRMITLVFVLIVCVNVILAEGQTIIFKKNPLPEDDKKDNPDKGHRTPPRDVIGYIDWDSNAIIMPGEISNHISLYEIWTSEFCIFSTTDENDFFMHAKELMSDSYVLVLVCDDYILAGHISLI